MKSLTHKLILIFIAMTMVPLLIGITAAVALQTAEKSLDGNNLALQNLTGLLTRAGDSLSEGAELQSSAKLVTSEIAGAQAQTYAALKEMGDYLLPRTFAIARIRQALQEATTAERAILLTLNMRHLGEQEFRATRDAQLASMDKALNNMANAKSAYVSLIRGNNTHEGWQKFETTLAAWYANHNDFMSEISNLEKLVEDLVRGGPLFTSSVRKAYDTAFITGRDIRAELEAQLESLNREIVDSAEAGVAAAVQSQIRSSELMQELGRETDLAAGRAEEIRTQMNTARLATNHAAEDSALALTGTTRLFWGMVVFASFGIVIAIIAGIVMSVRISAPIRNMAEHMEKVAVGDMQSDVSELDRARTDEIGQLARSMQEMIQSTREETQLAHVMASGDYTHHNRVRSEKDLLGKALAAMLRNTNIALGQVSRAINTLGDGSAAVSEASRSLSLGAQTSAAALEEISQTVNQVDGQAKENADNAKEANRLATASRDSAKRGYKAVSELVAAMNQIRESGKKIASVAKLIDDIAFQTNLLALNAAVEAARAGRHGRGFSVVADEVRNLSGRSAKAARETSDMVRAMTEMMDDGAELATRSDQEFLEIVDATDQVANLFSYITEASNSQSAAMAQIAQGLGQIDSVIQETSHNSEQTANSAYKLTLQANKLRQMVGRFRLSRSRHDTRFDYAKPAPALTGPDPEPDPDPGNLLTNRSGTRRLIKPDPTHTTPTSEDDIFRDAVAALKDA